MAATTSTPRPGAASPAQGRDAAERRRWLMLVVLITGQFMALLDVTIVNVAIPTIHARLHASGAALQLVVAGYTVTYAMLLITGARLGDLRGPRNVFLTGLSTFTVASLACGLAPSTGALILARLVQGAGAALMIPQILSVIQRQFTGADRTRALGVYAATLASGAAIGQVLGGLLVSANLLGTAWRPVFLVNVPVGVVAAVLVPRLVPADHVPAGRRLDLAGLLTATVAVLLVVLPLVLGHEEGWPAWTWASLAVGLVLAGAFVLLERSVAAHGGDPLLNLQVLRAPGLAAGLSAVAAAMIGFGGFLFSLSLHLQLGLGDSALRAGLTFAPGAVAFGAAGYWWRRLPSQVHHALATTGFVVGALSLAGLAADFHNGTRGGPWVFALFVVFGLGFGAAYSSLVVHALVGVPRTEAADASGLLTTTIQLSQVLGVAVLGSLFLSLAAHPRLHASAVAFSTVDLWVAALTLAGVAGTLLVARTARSAMRTAAATN